MKREYIIKKYLMLACVKSVEETVGDYIVSNIQNIMLINIKYLT
jgi:hypothetical protein